MGSRSGEPIELSRLSLLEAALEAWAECGAEGFELPERRALALLLTLGAHLPGSDRGLAERARCLEALLPSTLGAGIGEEDDDAASRLKLHPQEGKVHFLRFWQVFSEITRIVGALGGSENSDGSDFSNFECCLIDIEQLRDTVLAFIDGGNEAVVSVSFLVEIVHKVKDISGIPEFWREVLESLRAQAEVNAKGFFMKDLTVLFLCWLHDAIMWQHTPAVNLRTGMLVFGNLRTGMLQGPVLDLNGTHFGFGNSRADTPGTDPQVFRPPSESCLNGRGEAGRFLGLVARPPSSLMASAALVLDLEEHWRACGVMGPSGGLGLDSRPVSHLSDLSCSPTTSPSGRGAGGRRRIASEEGFQTHDNGSAVSGCANASLLVLKCEVAEGHLASTMAAAETLSCPRDVTGMPTPVPRPSSMAGRSQTPLPPLGPPPASLHIQNLRTALMPLDATPRPAELFQDSVHEGFPVFLHIYDVSQEASIQRLNSVLAHKLAPLKLGGVFHAGVEVNGIEWSYGRSFETASGVTRMVPRADPQHHFRQTVTLPRTMLSDVEVVEIVAGLEREYFGKDYDVLRRNCCHFADDFCQRLGVGRIPGWVYRLARIGARFDGVLRPGVSGLPRSNSMSCSASPWADE